MVREKVKKNAPWYIYDFQDLISELEQASGNQQQQQQSQDLYETTEDSAYQLSDSEALSTSPVCMEGIGVKAS